MNSGPNAVHDLVIRFAAHASVIFSAVAGASNLNSVSPCGESRRAALIADLMPKNTDAARNSGGSPIP